MEITLTAQRTPSATRSMWSNLEWRNQAACSHVDTNLFFPIGVTGPAIDQIDRAKAVCRTCPAMEPCLEFALATHQQYGVWGGHTEEERRAIRRARRAAARAARLRAS